ncbi:MAG: bifunctional folylpolyglutamate synthase/dihydrofolate synthase [Gammaproteobacteria bacterium]|nr:bifunctional folylpolyglutamate synthase/dihydrofolate synthase [Gammaproteobacteria bacterium]
MTKVDSVADWLATIDAQPTRRTADNAAELLIATKQIAEKLEVMATSVPVITVTGTNGKGSCVALLEAIYLAAGYRVATTTSPHLIAVNERIRINGKTIDDKRLCQALSQVVEARGDVAISFFTLLYLAALKIFSTQSLDLIITEAGIGGRYDASNIIDADVAIIASIALDHCHILGNCREQIAEEKAGIMRPQRPLICGDRAPPANLRQLVEQQTSFYQLGCDFNLIVQPQHYQWSCQGGRTISLPRGHLLADNIATAVMAVEQLQLRLPVKLAALRQGVATANLLARRQYIAGRPALVMDIAHNIAAVNQLADYLLALPCRGRKHAIFACLADKDGSAMVSLLAQQMDYWYISEIDHARAADMTEVVAWLTAADCHYRCFTSPSAAFHTAMAEAEEEDMVILFGSFHLVGEIWPLVEGKKEII